MEIRFFQIVIPILVLLFMYSQYLEYRKGRSGIYEIVIISVFSTGIVLLALFPDLLSEIIASVFGIKSNINAVIFFALGVLLYFQFKMFKLIKKQDEVLTKLARKIALDEHEKS